MNKKRIAHLYLYEKQYGWLEREAKEHNISVSQLIREIVDKFIDGEITLEARRLTQKS